MKQNLFSSSHLAQAKKLNYPVDDLNWLNALWTEEEINACKREELKGFISKPKLSTYPQKNFILSPLKDPSFSGGIQEVLIIDSYFKANPWIKTFLSIGCGMGQKEL